MEGELFRLLKNSLNFFEPSSQCWIITLSYLHQWMSIERKADWPCKLRTLLHQVHEKMCCWMRPTNTTDNIWLSFSQQHDNEAEGKMQSPSHLQQHVFNHLRLMALKYTQPRTLATAEQLTLNKWSRKNQLHCQFQFFQLMKYSRKWRTRGLL